MWGRSTRKKKTLWLPNSRTAPGNMRVEGKLVKVWGGAGIIQMRPALCQTFKWGGTEGRGEENARMCKLSWRFELLGI